MLNYTYLNILVLILLIYYYDKIIDNIYVKNQLKIILKIIQIIHNVLIFLNKLSKMPFTLLNKVKKVKKVYNTLKEFDIQKYTDYNIVIFIIIISFVYNNLI